MEKYLRKLLRNLNKKFDQATRNFFHSRRTQESTREASSVIIKEEPRSELMLKLSLGGNKKNEFTVTLVSFSFRGFVWYDFSFNRIKKRERKKMKFSCFQKVHLSAPWQFRRMIFPSFVPAPTLRPQLGMSSSDVGWVVLIGKRYSADKVDGNEMTAARSSNVFLRSVGKHFSCFVWASLKALGSWKTTFR